MEKQRQHYVWEHHLRSWSNSSNQIWCYRLDDKNCFLTNTGNVAHERYFYQSKELSIDDVNYLINVIIGTGDMENLRDYFMELIYLNNLPFLLKKYCKTTNQNSTNDVLDKFIKKFREDVFANEECRFIPILEKIKNNDLSFIGNPKEINVLYSFLVSQYFRTKRSREKIMRSLNNDDINNYFHCNKDSVINIVCAIFSARTTLSMEREGYNISFVKNNTDKNFIVGDQPIINVLWENEDKRNEEIKLVYPINPKLCIVLSKNCDPDIILENNFEILAYNKLFLKYSYTQCFAKEREDLDDLLK